KWANNVASGLPFSLLRAGRRAPASPNESGGRRRIRFPHQRTRFSGMGGNRHAWKLDDGVLTGRSDGSLPAVLVVSHREFGEFELRFEARVHRGAVRVKMHGPGPGPLGVALEIK